MINKNDKKRNKIIKMSIEESFTNEVIIKALMIKRRKNSFK
jgi:hypothetical protein